MTYWTLDDTDFNVVMREHLEKNKQKKESESFWPSPAWRSRFLRKYKLRYGLSNESTYEKSGYLAQLVPALEMTYALRHVFEIKGGTGKIWNADESLTYRFMEKKRTWTV